MTTINTIDAHCPCCGNTFKTKVWMSTNTLGPSSTDFHQRAAGFQSLPLEIHMCPDCGYSGTDKDFGNLRLKRNVTTNVRKYLTPLVINTEEAIPAGKQYECAALIAKWRGDPIVAQGDLYLRAAWCCEDDQMQEAERVYRNQAIICFEEALVNSEIEPAGVAVYTYLVGELYRRIGNSEQANIWFGLVPQAAGADPEKKWLVDLAIQQQHNPQDFIHK